LRAVRILQLLLDRDPDRRYRFDRARAQGRPGPAGAAGDDRRLAGLLPDGHHRRIPPVSRALDYPALLREATIGLVREVLARTAADGLPGDHHFSLTFRTTEPGVEIPPNLLAQYPETLTIVLQNQFWDLEVGDDAFEVTLRF